MEHTTHLRAGGVASAVPLGAAPTDTCTGGSWHVTTSQPACSCPVRACCPGRGRRYCRCSCCRMDAHPHRSVHCLLLQLDRTLHHTGDLADSAAATQAGPMERLLQVRLWGSSAHTAGRISARQGASEHSRASPTQRSTGATGQQGESNAAQRRSHSPAQSRAAAVNAAAQHVTPRHVRPLHVQQRWHPAHSVGYCGELLVLPADGAARHIQ